MVRTLVLRKRRNWRHKRQRRTSLSIFSEEPLIWASALKPWYICINKNVMDTSFLNISVTRRTWQVSIKAASVCSYVIHKLNSQILRREDFKCWHTLLLRGEKCCRLPKGWFMSGYDLQRYSIALNTRQPHRYCCLLHFPLILIDLILRHLGSSLPICLNL